MTKGVGTLAWARKRSGSLSSRDRLSLLGQAMLSRISRYPRRLRKMLGLDASRLSAVDLARIRIPDSHAAAQADSMMRSACESWIVNHCLRTYCWAGILGQVNRVRHDEELLFVACALHDLGLGSTYRHSRPGCRCFALVGATVADEFAQVMQWEAERRSRLSEAISLHLNVRVGLGQGAEAHLLHAGAALDLTGARAREIPGETISEVCLRHPRDDFRDGMVTAMHEEARSRPDSRAAFLVRLGLVRMIEHASLERQS